MLVLVVIVSTQLNIDAARNSALHHIEEGEWTKALEYAKIVITENPNEYLLLGLIRYGQIIDSVVDVDPATERAIITNRHLIFKSWEDLAKLHKHNLNILSVLMVLYSTAYRTGAYKYAHKVLALDSLNGLAHYILGHSAENDGDFSRAIVHYSKATQLDTTLKTAYSRIAAIHLIQNEYDSSLAYYHKAPYDHILSNSEHIGEAICAIAKGTIDQAERIVNELRELEITWYVETSLKALTEYIHDCRAANLTEKDTFIAFGPFVGPGITLRPTQWVAIITKNGVDIVYDIPLENPVPIRRYSPRYPGSAVRARAQGQSMVIALLNTDGTVSKADIQTSSGSWELDNAALEAARKWRFRPARVFNIPIKIIVHIPINFKLVNNTK